VGKLDGEIAVVTGAGRGIGRAIALAFAEAGAQVTVASRSASTVRGVVEEIEGAGGEALGVTCDVGSEQQVQDMVARTVERFGAVSILVNNAQGFGTPAAPAGSPGQHRLEHFPEDEWDHTFHTGLKGTLYCMKAVFPLMKERGGGRILNFGSGNGVTAMPGTAAYNATKEAIRSLTRTGAKEWGRHGITVNVLVPTMVTDSARDFLSARPGIEERLTAQIPLGRMGDVERDIGPVAVFLASADAGYITGQTIHVDGGQILRP
jgi:NAD(P)-dependent dehydrogenase (short-subunit alcohol dehydrogenase family)